MASSAYLVLHLPYLKTFISQNIFYPQNQSAVSVLKYFNFQIQRNNIPLKRSIQTEYGDKQIFSEHIISRVSRRGRYKAQLFQFIWSTA